MNAGSLFKLYAISVFPHVELNVEPNHESAVETVKVVKHILLVPVVLSALAGIVGCTLAAFTQNHSLHIFIAKRLTVAFGSIAAAIFVLGFGRFYHQMTR